MPKGLSLATEGGVMVTEPQPTTVPYFAVGVPFTRGMTQPAMRRHHTHGL